MLVDDNGRVLLRKPSGEFDGYVWTFPKGRGEKGETPEQTALREVYEETGYTARTIRKIEGSFTGSTTVTEYFLMSPVGKPRLFDAETAAIRWVPLNEATHLIELTRNVTGRCRDLAVLNAVRKMLNVY